MLTDRQKSEFDVHGWLRLPGAIPEEDIQIVLDRIWDDLEQRCGIPRGDPENWPESRPKGFNTLTRSGVFEPTCNQAVQDAVDDLLGPGQWEKPSPWGALLLTFPSNGSWFLPNHSWHMDLQASVSVAADKTPGVQVFVVLEPLPARGGATIGLSGSHRLVRHLARQPELIDEGRSKDISKAVRRAAPNLRDLWSHDSGGDREAAVPAESSRCFWHPRAGRRIHRRSWRRHIHAPVDFAYGFCQLRKATSHRDYGTQLQDRKTRRRRYLKHYPKTSQ